MARPIRRELGRCSACCERVPGAALSVAVALSDLDGPGRAGPCANQAPRSSQRTRSRGRIGGCAAVSRARCGVADLPVPSDLGQRHARTQGVRVSLRGRGPERSDKHPGAH